MKPPRIGPYWPLGNAPMTYAMLGDEPLMFAPKRRLNPFQRGHVETMRYDILPWAMCFVPVSRPQDEVLLDALFLEQRDFFEWHRRQYARLGVKASDRLRFVHPDRMYPEALTRERLVASVCFSHQVHEATDIAGPLRVSKRVNSKTDLVRRARRAGFSMPETVVLEKRELTARRVRKHFDFPGRPLLLKTDGLGGGFNVKGVASFEEIAAFTRDFAPGAEFLLQEKIDRAVYSEYIADFVVRSDRTELVAARLKLTSDNKWFGNVYSPHLRFTAPQLRNLERCAQDVQRLGYHSPEGFICGIDFFQSEHDQRITEINARWTGGLPVELYLRKLGLADRVVFSHVDELPVGDIERYQRFVERHLFGRGGRDGFSVVPVSFSPKVTDGKLYVWFCVVGDYGAFARAAKSAVSREALPLSSTVARLAREKRALIGPLEPVRRPA